MNTKLFNIHFTIFNDLITSEDLTRHRIGNALLMFWKAFYFPEFILCSSRFHKSIPINYARFLENFPSDLPIFVSKQAISKGKTGYFIKHFLNYSVFQKYSIFNQ